MISGYFCKGEWAEIKRKAFRLIKIFVIGEALYFAHYLYYARDRWQQWLAENVNADRIFSLVVYNDTGLFLVGWFLIALLYMYFVFAFIKKLKLEKIAYVFMVILIAVQWALPRMDALNGTNYFSRMDYKVLRAFAFFMLGYFWKEHYEKIRKILKKPIIYGLMVVGVYAIYIERKLLKVAGYTNAFYLYIGTIMIVIGLFGWALYCPQVKNWKELAYIGRNLSVYIYVLHIIVYRMVLIKMGPLDIAWMWVAVTIVSYIVYNAQTWIKEKMKEPYEAELNN